MNTESSNVMILSSLDVARDDSGVLTQDDGRDVRRGIKGDSCEIGAFLFGYLILLYYLCNVKNEIGINGS